jgi:hypothetical protein
MTAFSFNQLDRNTQIAYLRRKGKLIDTVIRGNFLISLYWTKELIFEVFLFRDNLDVFEIKIYDRKQYPASDSK